MVATPDGPRPVAAGMAAGIAAGAVWWGVELGVNWACGGFVPPAVSTTLFALDVALGAVAGTVLQRVFRRARDDVRLALALAIVYGLTRVVGAPGVTAEALFLVLAGIGTAVGLRVAGADRHGRVPFLHVTVLTTLAMVVGTAAGVRLQPAAGAYAEPRGVLLVGLLAGLPLLALLADAALRWLIADRPRRFAAELGIALVAALALGRPLATAPLDVVDDGPRPTGTLPDVILVSLDTTRADHLSTYGYQRDTSPNLTAFASDALTYTLARSTAQWTVPGHASLFTGMFPSRHGAHYAGPQPSGPEIGGRRRVFPLGAEHETLAEVLREQGYRCGAFIANFANLYRAFGMAQGFEHYDDAPGLLWRPLPHVVQLARNFVPTLWRMPFRSAHTINAAALDWIDRVPADRPVFVFLNYLEPHYWLAEPPYDRWSRALPQARRLAGRALFTHAIPAGFSEAERQFAVANYDGQIAAMDAALGEFLAALRERGRFENALIVITADHGELLGEHGQAGHGGKMMYEGVLRVPLVVKYPGTTRARGRDDRPVQILDVFPTILDTVRAPLPAGVQGQVLDRVTHDLLAEEHINPELVQQYGDVYDRGVRVLYDGPYKLIATSRGERLLFDLVRDPDEEHDLSARERQRVAMLTRRLERAMATAPDTVAIAR